jgi:AcrR family transcriptional regulator
VNVIHDSPNLTRRQRKRLERIDAILAAASGLVRQDGLDGLTMQSLAAEMDASVGAVYRYFPGKQALLTGLQVKAVRALSELLEQRVQTSRDPLERVELAFGSWRAFALAEPSLFALVDRSLSDPRRVLDEQQAAQVRATIEPVLQRCAGLLQDAVQSGRLAPGDADLRAHALWAGVRGAHHFRKQRQGPSADAVEAELIRALLKGWHGDCSSWRPSEPRSTP